MGFPKEFPQQAINALLAPVLGQKPFDSTAVLGGYDIVGFALYQVFGDVQYMLNADSPDHVANLLAQAPPEVQQFMQYINRQGDTLIGADPSQAVPPWLIPFAMQAVQWALQKLLDRFSKQENPTLFGMPIKHEMRQLPPQTGGAFPERMLGQPTGTGLHTQSHPPITESQKTGAQSQPSNQMQQPTGNVPQQHPSNPQGSKSPQFQANTADPNKQHEARPADANLQKEANVPGTGPLTTAPGQPGNPTVPVQSGGVGGQPGTSGTGPTSAQNAPANAQNQNQK